MPRNVTITFDDGSSHVYQNVPDDVAPDRIEARASHDFGKDVTHIDGGASEPNAAQALARKKFDQRMADQKEYAKPDERPGASVARFAEGVGAFFQGAKLAGGQMLGVTPQSEVDQFKDESVGALANPAGFIGGMAGGAAATAPVAVVAAPVGAAATAALGGGRLAAAAGGALVGGAQGAVGGAMLPTSEGESRATNVGLGAAGGAAVGGTLSGLQRVLELRAQQGAVDQVANQVRDNAAKQALQVGYKLSPTEANPTVTNSAAEGFSGKFLTRQTAQLHNQEVSDSIAKSSLPGFQQEEALTHDALDAYRKQVVQKYYRPLDELGDMPTGGPNGPLDDLMAGVGVRVRALGMKFSRYKAAAERVNAAISDVTGGPIQTPRAVDNGSPMPDYRLMAPKAEPPLWNNDSPTRGKPTVLNINDAVDLISDYRSDAKNLFTKARGPEGSKEDFHVASAYLQIADALEQFIDLNAKRVAGTYAQTGQPEQAAAWAAKMAEFQKGRSLIARSLNIDRALTGDGHVDALQLGRMAARPNNPVPLGGGLEIVAQTANSFKHVMGPVRNTGAVPQFSLWDAALGVGSAAATQNYGAAAAVFARPLTRSFILSKLYQDTLGGASASYPKAPSGLLSDIVTRGAQ